jgi:A/G-specific adenine glycosylase
LKKERSKRKTGGAFDPVLRLSEWFARNRRDLPWRRCRDLYAIWVSEVMLQQTRVGTVLPYYRNFLKSFPTLKRLAEASLQDVLKSWEGLGYYSRARNLWRSARLVREKFHGRIPDEYGEFRGLPGVGEYTAAAVLSIGRGLAVPVVDGNVLRVVCRWQGIGEDTRLPATRRSVRSRLEAVIPAAAPGLFNEALMELGALVCVPKEPLCRRCPLRPDCFAFCHGRTGSLPVLGKRKPVPSYRVALAVIAARPGEESGGRVYIQQRPEHGHLGGLWEFPGGKCRAGEKAEAAVVRECREELGVEVEILAKLAEVRHAYSHFKVVLHVFICKRLGGRIRSRNPHVWIKIGELGRYPFPAANHKFFPLLKKMFS